MFELIILSSVGAICIYLGLMIWKKERIRLIHSYHYKKVKEEDMKAYTKMMGEGTLIIGIGSILTGIINYMASTAYGWFLFGLFFIIGFVIISISQKKYNNGFF